MSVTAIGSIALDSLSVPTGEYTDVLGGAASHFATSCRLFEEDIAIVGVVGEDFPEEYRRYFTDRNINIEGLKTAPGQTFRWHGKYQEHSMGEAQTLDTQLNVFETFDPVIEGRNEKPDYLFLGNIHPALQMSVASRVDAGLKVLDTMNLWIQTTSRQLREVLGLIDVLIFNDGEARLLTGTSNLIEAGRIVLDLGPSAVVIKRGEHGCMLITREDVFSIPGMPVHPVIDPTGAGDSFAGGFVGYLSTCAKPNLENMRRAVAYGNVMGSFNVEGVGVEVLSRATREQVEERFETFRNLVKF